jgi:hypothetical protein
MKLLYTLIRITSEDPLNLQLHQIYYVSSLGVNEETLAFLKRHTIFHLSKMVLRSPFIHVEWKLDRLFFAFCLSCWMCPESTNSQKHPTLRILNLLHLLYLCMVTSAQHFRFCNYLQDKLLDQSQETGQIQWYPSD